MYQCKICNTTLLKGACIRLCSMCNHSFHTQCLGNAVGTSFVSQVNCICPLCIKEVFPFSNIDDNEIADLVICKPAVEDLSKIVFSPFDLNDINDLTPISHIDPDKQYFNTVTERCNSLYYNEESFNDRCTSLGNHKHNISVIVESWKIIKKVINKNTTNLVSKRFSLNDDYITHGNIIADHFNDMYVNLGKNLSANINTVSNRAPESYISLCNKNSLYFEPVSEDEIVKIVLQMKNSSPGSDGITAKILKQSCHQILQPLSHVLNLSLLNGYFSEELKVAQVVPIFKTGDPTKFINYRPVSLLSVFSKL